MKLLLVEDEPDLLAGLALALRKQGYAVDTSTDGEDGLFKAQSYDYDAIILDIMLPCLDGWTVLARLREVKNTPVLILTARDQFVDRVRGLDTGADDYLVKPFDVSELFARLRALIRRSVGQSRATFEIGDVHIDTVSRTVTRASETVTLTAREYQMLEFFAFHRGRVISRSTLYEHLFDSK
jgi:two-component system OmpR family response regulator